MIIVAAKHLPSELSGGQQQRVAIARALVKQRRISIRQDVPAPTVRTQPTATA